MLSTLDSDFVNETKRNEEYIISKGFKVCSHNLNTFPVALVLIILAVTISRGLQIMLKPLKQPKFVCQVLSGLILGPSVLGGNKSTLGKLIVPIELVRLNAMATTGIIFQLFILSVKVDKRVIFRSESKVWSIGISSALIPIVCAFLVHYFTVSYFDKNIKNEWSLLTRAYLIFAMATLPHVAQLMDEVNKFSSELGEIAISCAGINEMIKWVIFVIMLVWTSSENILGVTIEAAVVCMTMTALFYFLRPNMVWFFKTIEGKGVDDFFIAAVFVGALIMAYLSKRFYFFTSIGAIVWGLVIPDGLPLGATLIYKSEIFISEVLMPAFFVFVGLSTNLLSIKAWDRFCMYQLFIIIGFLAKVIGTGLVGNLFHKINFKKSILLGVVLNTKGIAELSAITELMLAEDLDKPNKEQNYATLIVSVITISGVVAPLVQMYYNHDWHEITTLEASRRISDLSFSKRTPSCLHSLSLSYTNRIEGVVNQRVDPILELYQRTDMLAEPEPEKPSEVDSAAEVPAVPDEGLPSPDGSLENPSEVDSRAEVPAVPDEGLASPDGLPETEVPAVPEEGQPHPVGSSAAKEMVAGNVQEAQE